MNEWLTAEELQARYEKRWETVLDVLYRGADRQTIDPVDYGPAIMAALELKGQTENTIRNLRGQVEELAKLAYAPSQA